MEPNRRWTIRTLRSAPGRHDLMEELSIGQQSRKILNSETQALQLSQTLPKSLDQGMKHNTYMISQTLLNSGVLEDPVYHAQKSPVEESRLPEVPPRGPSVGGLAL